ncbi:transcriptional regulator [Microvirga lupini]|uniref:Transcriptional regulator n=1 Tax=Microvirga lupini TaxID=420324 RepID=A0A7W4VQF7_9HYPH|nr:FMN-binding negative transcriptional regulator [Microvirga lupini]MBB3021090.1 transcriptional regulator [Microvirga lupini]
MFVPAQYVAKNPRAIVEAYSFGLLVTTDANGLHATQTPIFFETDDPEEMRLVGHIARRNPQAAGLAHGQPALVVFTGPHAYISGNWYQSKPEVPTWNYVSAQVSGVLEPLDEPEQKRAVLEKTAQKLSAYGEGAWAMDDAPEGRVEVLLPYIRSFRIVAHSIQGASKLSQSHPQDDRDRVIARLKERGHNGDAEIARVMELKDPF